MNGRSVYIACALLGFSTTFAIGQEIDNTPSYKNNNTDKFIRFSGDDDYLSGTDDQYSFGMNLEVCAPWVKNFPLSKLLLHPPLYKASTKYGISIEQDAYTPTDLKREGVALHDRPFAAALFLNTYMISTDFERKERFSTMLSTGVIGPDALGKEVQNAAHVIMNDLQPPGWTYQIHNDLVLNYELNYEMEVYSIDHLLSLSLDAMSRIGTLNDKISPGMTVMMGHYQSPFSNKKLASRYQVFLYDHPEVSFIGYDATLQGGMFDHSSPYTLSSNDISRIVFKNSAGLTVIHNRFCLQFYHCYQTQQFIVGGHDHSWEGITLSTAFR